MNAILDNKDEITMSLVHYFVTEENYTPINVQGAKNEIWLENLEGPYKIIRINSKYIHNEEQYRMDIFKMQYVIKQIKRKTLSFKMNVLNICLDISESFDLDSEDKTIDTVNVTNLIDVKNIGLISNSYPKIKTDSLRKTDDLNKIINATDDINRKTAKENIKYENVFKPKKIVVTYLIMAICILMFIISLFVNKDFNTSLLILGANNRGLVLGGDYWRLLAAAFLHGNIIHLAVNMYSLYVIGREVETYMGKSRMLIIYLLSAFMGSLLSIVINENSLSIGASGAIFGLMGSLLYFGYHYRLYLSSALKDQIIPLIVVNLLLGFSISGIDNAAHIGGLIGGYLSTMIVGVQYKSKISDTINGIIVYTLLTIFLFYTVFKLV